MGTGQLHGKVVEFFKKEENETWKEGELWKKKRRLVFYEEAMKNEAG